MKNQNSDKMLTKVTKKRVDLVFNLISLPPTNVWIDCTIANGHLRNILYCILYVVIEAEVNISLSQ